MPRSWFLWGLWTAIQSPRKNLTGDADGIADIQRYELRTQQVGMKRHTRKEGTQYRIIPGSRPRAVIGPGRALLSMWIRAENLRVGDVVRRPVLDIREPFASIKESALRREPDRNEPTLGRVVRVYTFYGRETVFTDERGIVIGDLAGMRPSESLTTPEPPPMPMYGAPDPVNTP